MVGVAGLVTFPEPCHINLAHYDTIVLRCVSRAYVEQEAGGNRGSVVWRSGRS